MKITHEKQKRTVFSVGRTNLLRFVLMLTLALPFNLFAQKTVINGVVSDSRNESTISDQSFRLVVPGAKTILFTLLKHLFSYISGRNLFIQAETFCGFFPIISDTF